MKRSARSGTNGCDPCPLRQSCQRVEQEPLDGLWPERFQELLVETGSGIVDVISFVQVGVLDRRASSFWIEPEVSAHSEASEGSMSLRGSTTL